MGESLWRGILQKGDLFLRWKIQRVGKCKGNPRILLPWSLLVLPNIPTLVSPIYGFSHGYIILGYGYFTDTSTDFPGVLIGIACNEVLSLSTNTNQLSLAIASHPTSSESSPSNSCSRHADLTSELLTMPSLLHGPRHITARVVSADNRHRVWLNSNRPRLKTRSTSTDVAKNAMSVKEMRRQDWSHLGYWGSQWPSWQASGTLLSSLATTWAHRSLLPHLYWGSSQSHHVTLLSLGLQVQASHQTYYRLPAGSQSEKESIQRSQNSNE